MSAFGDTDDRAFVEAVARRVVDLLREEGLVAERRPRLLTVAQVAREFGVSADWLYANAEALGAIRMGRGPRARLRFDRNEIGERITALASPTRRKVDATTRDGGARLLPIRGRRGRVGGA
jgi:hypothetical protein